MFKFSFELFPPKNQLIKERFDNCTAFVAGIGAEFLSITFGAGGKSKSATIDSVVEVKNKYKTLPITAHLTCLGLGLGEIEEIIEVYKANGIENILALRGDINQKDDLTKSAFKNSVELTSYIKKNHPQFKVFVAAYPEKHPDAKSLDADVDFLKQKHDAGADGAITQYFFVNDNFYKFYDLSLKKNITMPIIPALLPIGNYASIKNFSDKCGTIIPQSLHQAFTEAEATNKTEPFAAAFCTAQSLDLYKNGFHHLHFYMLNNPEPSISVCNALKLFTSL
jgi:methylenetetrahydrofolate reductase (NADPH)